ncbi:hypothetical protein [Neobacillus jeddahensis]|uniref:hypothetical protein n=1 Tax=Neobacillus jeddahensis TaxID=1461580 RepID=UPI00058B7FB2|nr:hypothetical protein [Neobacillus jeddahensis]
MIFISSILIDLLFDIGGAIIELLIPDRAFNSKFEKNVSRLKEEDWFFTMTKDYRYHYIIYQNRKVRRFLANEKHVKMILSMDEERENFIRLVKEEHARFTGIHER